VRKQKVDKGLRTRREAYQELRNRGFAPRPDTEIRNYDQANCPGGSHIARLIRIRMTWQDRRAFLKSAGGGFGALAANALVAGEQPRPHFPSRIDSVIFLFMYGGPSQVDTFDPKPALVDWAGKAIPAYREGDSFFTDQTKPTAMPSPWKFAKHGESGLDVSELYPKVARHADDLCVIRSMHADSNNHGPALSQMNSGFVLPGYPTMGSWFGYGLGNENENLPGYVVLLDKEGAPVNGVMNWSSGFMPAKFQGVPFRSSGPPIANLGLAKNVSMDDQKARLQLLNRFNRDYADRNPADSALEARIEAYELAFRMQVHAPEVTDLSSESKATQAAYGLESETTKYFGRNCLMARRLVERGVRFVQVYSGGNKGPSAWDAHTKLHENHTRQCAQTDQPIAALLTDLKQRGLLERTLVVWGGEFGRLPTQQGSDGRDHNPFGFTMWLAGGGVRGGMTWGATDEFGYRAEKDKVHVHDLHATILHLLGLDHERLTYRHSGRDFRLTDVEGTVVREILS
jgi:hypothetical protein